MKTSVLSNYFVLSLWMVVILFSAKEAIAKPNTFRSPWEKNCEKRRPPSLLNNSPEAGLKPCATEGFLKKSFLQTIKFFQVFISPADGDRCPMYPSCSLYATEAVQTYGITKGIILTSDRLLRCGRERDYPLILHQERYHYFDPLKNNIIWKPKKKY